MPVRLAILATHPIQYQVPWFRHLAKQDWLETQVFFGDDHGLRVSHDAGFNKPFAWDLPMLEGYSHEFLENTARRPSVDRYFGVSTPSIGEKLVADRFDAVLALGWHTRSMWQGFRAARKAGLRLVLRGESNLLHPRPFWKSLLRRASLRGLFRQTEAFMAIGTLNRKFYLEHGVAEGKIFEAPYFVENERFAGGMAEREETRERLGVPVDDFVFLFSGKLIGRKRPMDLVQAWAALPPESREKSRVFFAGDGILRPRLEAAAAEIDGSRLQFLGFVNQTDLPALYGAADALVMPSDYGETWGLSANEAMAAGARAILSDRVGCGPDLVVEGVTGEIFPCGDLPALRGVLQRYVQDREWIRAPQQRSAVLDHISNFTMERATEVLRDILD